MTRLSLLFSAGLAIVSLLSAGPVQADPVTGPAKADVIARLKSLVEKTRTATWRHRTWQTDGKDEEFTVGKCYWQAPMLIRIDVEEGRGSGATALYKDGEVTGFMGGLLSFAKVSYDVRDEEVLSLRGQDIRGTGFLDDMALIVQQAATAEVEKSATGYLVRYREAQGLPATLSFDEKLRAEAIEVRENGKVVERYTYSEVRYNPALDDDVFDP